jgi:tyrosyl-tRNA synthetase
MDSWEGAKLNEAKEILAYELTKLVHGEEEAKKAKTASHALFAGGGDDSNMPTTTITTEQLTDGTIGIMDLMVLCKLAASKSEARRLVTQGGVFVNDEKVSDIGYAITEDMLKEGTKIRKGKKTFHKAIM